MEKQEVELVHFVCEKCGRMLVWTLPSAQVLCQQCGQWVRQQQRNPPPQGIRKDLAYANSLKT
ncbi:MAG TPA: hypothetical protein PKA28_11615 [Methylomusa anaerophila]|nr:hypothetical protein [Methylomusa anaerophila]HML89082.1 hypothetical protein [Methylomusa anaerophila]